MEVFLHHDGFAVEVDDVGFGTYDGGLGGLYDLHFRCLVHHAVNHEAPHDGQLQGIGLLHDAEVDFAIPQRGMGRDGEVVAHLVGVGERDEEGLHIQRLVGHDDGVGLLLHDDVVAQDVFEIGIEPPAWVFAVVFSHFGVVACARDADERRAVDVDGVDLALVAAVDDL